MAQNVVIEAVGHGVDRFLEVGVVEGKRPSAAGAEQVVVMLGAARESGLVAGRLAAAYLESLHQPLALERVHGSVNGRDANRATAPP